MTDSSIRVQGSSLFLDSQRVTTGAGAVERQGTVIGDGTDGAQTAAVVNGNLAVDLRSTMHTAFGQISVAHETPVIWSNFSVIVPDRLWTSTVTGTGAVTISSGRALVSAGTNGTAELRSKRAVRYLPGQGVVMRCTAPMPAITAATGSVHIGLGDLTNGIGFMQNQAEVVSVWTAVGGVVTSVPQSSWNGDKGDGLGELPLLDFTKGSPLSIRFQWLGYGIQQFQIAAPDGHWVTVHVIEYANSSATTWTLHPAFEAFVRASNTTGAGAALIYCPSIGVFIEGDLDRGGILRGEDHLLTVTASAGTFVPLMSLRCESTWSGVAGTPVNKNRIILGEISAANEGTTSLRFLVMRNATLTGAAFAAISSAQSIAAIDTTATAVAADATKILKSFGIGNGGSAQIDFMKFGYQISPGDTITLAVAKTAAAAQVTYGGVTWLEQL